MKAVFVSLFAATPHFETELELMADLLEAGHQVHVLRCRGELPSCQANLDHRPGACARCVSKVDNGLHRIASPRLTWETVGPVTPDPRLAEIPADATALKVLELDGANLGRGACATICGRIDKDVGLDPVRHAAEVRKQLDAAHHVYVATRRVLERERPDRVYVFNGRFATLWPVILAARELGITFYTHERGATAAHYMLRENRLPHSLEAAQAEMDALWTAAGAERERIAAAWFDGRRAGVEDAWLSFTKAQDVGRLPEGFDPTRHNVVVFNSTLEEYFTIEEWKNPLYPDEIVGLRRVLESLAGDPQVRVYVRVHPHMKGIARANNLQLRELEALEKTVANLHVIWPESPVHTYTLMEQARVVLTFGSTTGVEAAYWGKPSVLAGRAFYEKLGCAHVATSHDDVIACLRDPSRAVRPREATLPYGYWEATKGIRYRRFRPTGLFTGEYEGRAVDAGLVSKLTSAAYTVLGR